MAGSVGWGELPAVVRGAVERHTEPVAGAMPGGEGVSTDLRLVLDTAGGGVFVKGTGPEASEVEREWLDRGAAVAPFVPSLSPPLLFRVRAAGRGVPGLGA